MKTRNKTVDANGDANGLRFGRSVNRSLPLSGIAAIVHRNQSTTSKKDAW